MRTPALASLLALAALVTPVAARAQVYNTMDTSRTLITATGSARATAASDRALMMILIEPQAMSVEEAARSVASAERAVMDTLRKLNLTGATIQSFSNGVAPYRNNMSSMASASFSGRSVIRVEVTHIEQVPLISAAALAKGATFVTGPTYSSSAADSVRRSLMPQAFANARAEAEALARAAGGTLGRLVDITSTNLTNYVSDQQSFILGNLNFDNGQRSLPAGATTVNVTTRWLLIR